MTALILATVLATAGVAPRAATPGARVPEAVVPATPAPAGGWWQPGPSGSFDPLTLSPAPTRYS